MVGAVVVTVIVTISLLIFGAYYFIDPLGKRTSTRSRAETQEIRSVFPDQTPITPVESQFAQYLYGPEVIPSPTPIGTVAAPTLVSQPSISVRLTSNRKSLAIEFGNLSSVSRITYFVTYLAKAGARGVTGTIQVPQPSAPIKREVTLGTCSKNVCVYDEVTTPIDVRAIYRMMDGRDVELTKTVPY